MSTAICRHVHVNGARCGSPSLRDKIYCYHHIRIAEHHRTLAELPDPTPTIIHPIPKDHLDRMQREPILAQYYSGSALANRRASLLNLDFPPLEDRESIQLALSMLITAMAQNRIEPRSATAIPPAPPSSQKPSSTKPASNWPPTKTQPPKPTTRN